MNTERKPSQVVLQSLTGSVFINFFNGTKEIYSIVNGSLKQKQSPFFLYLSSSLFISVYVSIWRNCIVLYSLGHMAMALLLLRAKEGMYDAKQVVCAYGCTECVRVCILYVGLRACLVKHRY